MNNSLSLRFNMRKTSKIKKKMMGIPMITKKITIKEFYRMLIFWLHYRMNKASV